MYSLTDIGNGISYAANGLTHVIGTPIDWTLRTAGTALLYTASTGGKVVTKVAAGVTVGLGYPIATVSGIVAVSSGIYSLGPCVAYSNLPNIGTFAGFSKIALSPSDTTVQILDAALCPASMSTFVTATTVALISYSIARCARRAFN